MSSVPMTLELWVSPDPFHPNTVFPKYNGQWALGPENAPLLTNFVKASDGVLLNGGAAIMVNGLPVNPLLQVYFTSETTAVVNAAPPPDQGELYGNPGNYTLWRVIGGSWYFATSRQPEATISISGSGRSRTLTATNVGWPGDPPHGVPVGFGQQGADAPALTWFDAFIAPGWPDFTAFPTIGDGASFEPVGTGPSVELDNLAFGTHRFFANVVDNYGRTTWIVLAIAAFTGQMGAPWAFEIDAAKPVAAFTFKIKDNQVEFDGTPSHVADGETGVTIVDYQWDFYYLPDGDAPQFQTDGFNHRPDPGLTPGLGPKPAQAFNYGDDALVQLQVTDSAGLTGTTWQEVVIGTAALGLDNDIRNAWVSAAEDSTPGNVGITVTCHKSSGSSVLGRVTLARAPSIVPNGFGGFVGMAQTEAQGWGLFGLAGAGAFEMTTTVWSNDYMSGRLCGLQGGGLASCAIEIATSDVYVRVARSVLGGEVGIDWGDKVLVGNIGDSQKIIVSILQTVAAEGLVLIVSNAYDWTKTSKDMGASWQ